MRWLWVYIFGERNEAYQDLIDLCIYHSPGHKWEERDVVAGGGFVTQESVSNIFNCRNTDFMDEQYHLF